MATYEDLKKLAASEELGLNHIKETLEEIAAQAEDVFQPVRMYAVYDAKLLAFTDPRFARNDAVALRDFQADLPNSRYRQAPEDFALWFVGLWDLGTGYPMPPMPPDRRKIIVEARSLVKDGEN